MTGLLLLEMSGMPLKNNGGANITIRSAKAASNEGFYMGKVSRIRERNTP